jgi:hypothetical protein
VEIENMTPHHPYIYIKDIFFIYKKRNRVDLDISLKKRKKKIIKILKSQVSIGVLFSGQQKHVTAIETAG